MKKFNVLVLSLLSLWLLSSCAEEGSCSFKGNWKVKSADVQSAKLPASILQMTKDEIMATTYTFTKDGKVTVNGGEGSLSREGTWSYDKNSSQLTCSGKLSTGADFTEVNQIDACTGTEITLSQRSPADTTQAEIARVSFVLEKVQ